jgi:lipopolysaccharide transport system ATP-binding protein
MSAAIIEATGLGKRYRIGTRAPYKTLREAIAGIVGAAGRRRPEGPADEGTLWALRDVSFRVAPGEALGIIGRNGAGKTTLLKILSRITEPSTGEVRLRGRVGSLLEVGTGFHPELTGRENIFLNGAILGMRTAEVKRKFDEIVAFAEVERFLDTPVKHYSSGMYVRLAFAVAAHLEPEILLVDEVLAVGDAAFQKKCLGKMEQVGREGRTVLFVSHQLPMIRSLCSRAILLDRGGVVRDGLPGEVIDAYVLDLDRGGSKTIDVSGNARSQGDQAAIREAWVENERGEPCSEVLMGRPFSLCYRFVANRTLVSPGYGFGIENIYAQRIFSLSNYLLERDEPPPAREGVVRCAFPECTLLPGTYLASISLMEMQSTFVDYIERALRFTVVANDVFGTGRMLESSQGVVYARGRVRLEGVPGTGEGG